MEDKNLVEQELHQILASRLLETKKQASNFLAYIVKETLAGRGDKITQYAIAIEALGKPHDYCPTENPAVRVEAGRVRKLLEEYYNGEGKNSPLRITLPVGSYQPLIDWVIPTTPAVASTFVAKSIQSQGPKVYISCQNPADIRDDALRNLIYNMRSGLPTALGKFREVRIALTQAEHVGKRRMRELVDYAWQQQQAEFLLQCAADNATDHFAVRFTLLHTLTHTILWEKHLALPLYYSPTDIEQLFAQLVLEAFSLHKGIALLHWSRYWKQQSTIPSHYQVLVEHVHFIQDNVGSADLRPFLAACQTRTQHYHDDALAHLHYAILCLYAQQLKVDLGTPLGLLWHQLALKAIELNPGNSLAHAIFALECFYRGDQEMGQVEIDTVRHSNPLDQASGHLLAIGLCALRHWEQAFVLLRDVTRSHSPYPDPLRTVPCLYFFRRGLYAQLAVSANDLQALGGWETFGIMTNHCRAQHCQGCIQTLSNAVDKVNTDTSKTAANRLWDSLADTLKLAAPASSPVYSKPLSS